MDNKIVSELLRYKNPLQKVVNTLTTQIRSGGGELNALADKIEHMAIDIGSPISIIPMLIRIVTKGQKHQSQGTPGFERESLGYGHFRWDWKARILNNKEIAHLKEILKKLGTNTEEDNEYNKYAKECLKKCNTIMTTEYYMHDKYFKDDKDKRDIYNITLKNNKGIWTFTFGQSINNTGISPTEYDIITCLTKYDPGKFQEFCSEYGYEEDSRKAERVYQAVSEEWKMVRKLFTDEEIGYLQEIQ